MIEIERTQNDKLTRLNLGSIAIWFSYETPVAYTVPGMAGVIVSDKGWSVSTRRHLGTIEFRNAPIPHAEFEAGLERIEKAIAGVALDMRVAELNSKAEVNALDARAEAMYDEQASYQEFADAFTVAELEQLATLCQISLTQSGRSYDDEVFDALAIMKSAS